MSLVLEMAIEKAAREAMHHFLYNDLEGAPNGGYNDTAVLGVIAKRRRNKMIWMDFSDAELRIVDEVEKNPGMKQTAIVSLMSVHDEAYPDGTCEAGTVRFLLANLVKRKVLIASGTNGYTLNDSDYPPAKPYIRK